jgi:hypothetical protein
MIVFAHRTLLHDTGHILAVRIGGGLQVLRDRDQGCSSHIEEPSVGFIVRLFIFLKGPA